MQAAKRAKQIMRTGKKKVDINASNPLTIALEEIKLGLVTDQTLLEEEQNLLMSVEETENQENEMDVAEEIININENDSEEADVEETSDEDATKEDILRKNLTSE